MSAIAGVNPDLPTKTTAILRCAGGVSSRVFWYEDSASCPDFFYTNLWHGKVHSMSRWEKVLSAVMAGRSDSSIRFDELIHAVERLGFTKRVSGSHHILQKNGFNPINLQPVSGMAKPYQVRQVRKVLEQGSQL